jgi:hypothetical protein
MLRGGRVLFYTVVLWGLVIVVGILGVLLFVDDLVTQRP